MNFVDCSLAPVPRCTDLHRSPCQETTNTCGPCLPDFVGDSGDQNSPCVSLLSQAFPTNLQRSFRRFGREEEYFPGSSTAASWALDAFSASDGGHGGQGAFSASDGGQEGARAGLEMDMSASTFQIGFDSGNLIEVGSDGGLGVGGARGEPVPRWQEAQRSCALDSECPRWQQCLGSSCRAVPKACISDCSGSGTCAVMSSSGNKRLKQRHCYVGDASCVVQCVCYSGRLFPLLHQ